MPVQADMFQLTEAPPTPEGAKGLPDFLAVGQRFVSYMKDEGLKPEDRVLDVGCGAGRLAAALANYLDGGTYEGIDVELSRITWAASHIPLDGFRFVHVDIENGLYNPDGTELDRFRFPYRDGEFDFVVATSLYTHLVPADMTHYISETARVLKPGGVMFSTFFIIDPFSREQIGKGVADWFKVERDDGTWVADPEQPEIAIGYTKLQIVDACVAAGLTVTSVQYGSWCRRPAPTDYQDMVFARR